MNAPLRAFVAFMALAAVLFVLLTPKEWPFWDRRPPPTWLATPRLLDATLEELQAALGTGAITSVDLTRAYLARIREVNPELHAVMELNPAALAIASSLDTERAAGLIRGPLHGLPVLIKDNIATLDGMNTTAGSYALVGARVPDDSGVVTRLRRAGAIVLGKANLSQWANTRAHAWSATGGPIRGAYYPNQDPSGSSGGSGVASSLGLAWAALGTETRGSILSPAFMNNIVGIKPSVGLTSRYLVVPVSQHMDTVGPMARTVKDAAHLLTAIAGPDPHDNYTSAIPFATMPDYAAACDGSALRGKRIGVPRALNIYWNVPDLSNPIYPFINAVFNHSLDVLRDAGATIVEDVEIPGWQTYMAEDVWTKMLLAGLFTDIPHYFSQLVTNPHNITTLEDLRRFTHDDPREGWAAGFHTSDFDAAIELGWNSSANADFWPAYQRALYLTGPLGLTGALANHSLDAMVMQTSGALAILSALGAPGVTVPMGRFPDGTPVVMFEDKKNPDRTDDPMVAAAPNMPLGITFFAGRWTEEMLIGMAYDYEQRTMFRSKVKPYMQPKVELEDVVGRSEYGDV